MDFTETIKKRVSIRKYSDKKPKIVEIVKAVENANLAPSPGNLAILRYLIIEDPNKIEKIAEACQQEFIKQAKILVIVCSESRNVTSAYDIRAKKYIKQHAGASIENFLLNITDLGLASCWVGAFAEDLIKDALEITEEIDIEAVLPVGYISKIHNLKPRKKPLLESRIFFETWKNKYRKPFPIIKD
jgi:nitroreductase